MWYNKVVNNLSEIANAVTFFNNELAEAQKETRIRGSLEKNAQELSGIMGYRFGQLQEIEAILKHVNIKYDKLRSDHYKKYNERYQRELTDRSIEKYIDGEIDVVTMSELINEVSLVRNRYLAIIKALELKHYQLTNIVKLRTVGLENTTLDSGNVGS